jgi:hypothetical protein
MRTLSQRLPPVLSNLILGAVLVAFVVFHTFADRAWSRERQRLIDAIISKNSTEFLKIQNQKAPQSEPEEVRDPEAMVFPEGF